MKKIWLYLTMSWQATVVVAFAAILVMAVLLFQLGSLTQNRVHPAEVIAYDHNISLKNVLDQPLNAPYFVLRDVMHKTIKRPSVIMPRFVSVLFALVIILAFYKVLTLWYSQRVVVLGTLLFASSSWLLHLARIGTPDILQSLGIVFVIFSSWLHKIEYRKFALLFICVGLACLIYVPGMIWLIIAGAIWRGKQIVREALHIQRAYLIFCLTGLGMLIAPLIWASILHPSTLLQIAGLPNRIVYSQLVDTAIHLPLQIFVKSRVNPLITVGHKPLLDMFTAVMVIIGIYDSAKGWKLDRHKIMFGLLVIGIIICILSSSVLLTFLLVPTYLFAVAGIAYMLDEWYRVFPRNPLAKGIATTLLSVAVLCTAYFHISSYFIAWPNSPVTRAAFSQRY